MIRNGRPEDPVFEPTEVLYRRVKPDSYFEVRVGKRSKKKLSLYAVDPPDVSVTRSKYNGKPEYVLYDDVRKIHHKDWGIVSLKVEQIPENLAIPSVVYFTKLKHNPHRENYHHSEIQVYDSGDHHIKKLDDFPVEFVKRWQDRMRSVLVAVKLPAK